MKPNKLFKFFIIINIYLNWNMILYVLLKRLNVNLKIYIYLIMEINKEISPTKTSALP